MVGYNKGKNHHVNHHRKNHHKVTYRTFVFLFQQEKMMYYYLESRWKTQIAVNRGFPFQLSLLENFSTEILLT